MDLDDGYDGPPIETDPANMRVYINNMKNSDFHTFGAFDFTADNDQHLNIGYWDYFASNRYPFNYVALMMDRFNYPGMQGPNWTYGALYLYHGYD